MAARVPNYAKGRFAAWGDDINAGAATCRIVLLKTTQTLDELQDHETLSALLAAGGGTVNVECNADGYTRQELATITVTVNHTTNEVTVDTPDLSYNNAGATTANTGLMAIFCYDPDGAGAGSDTAVRPMALSEVTFAMVGGASQTLTVANFAKASN